MSLYHDVVIVGAGAAGTGLAVALQQAGVQDLLLVDRFEPGASFLRWPAETRFITPSFFSNPFGNADLNAITMDSSPALIAGREHPDGVAYARYLRHIIKDHRIPTRTSFYVERVSLLSNGHYRLQNSSGETIESRALIWATGEFQFPDKNVFPGAHLCCHYAEVNSWRDFSRDEYIVIGGYESAADATIHLIQQGCNVKMLTRSAPWAADHISDPSISLSPYTRERLQSVLDSPRLEIYEGADVCDIEKSSHPNGGYIVHARDGRHWFASQRPILATGFLCGGGARQISSFFAWNSQGFPQLTAEDASTLFPGLYLAGPQVRHAGNIYCFIYKYRTRFPVVTQAICQFLNIAVKHQDNSGFAIPGDICVTDDTSCC